MTISQIRRRIDALKRKFARELAIVKLRLIAESVADQWTISEFPPEPVRRHPARRQSRLPPQHLHPPQPLPQRHPARGQNTLPEHHGARPPALGRERPLPPAAPLGTPLTLPRSDNHFPKWVSASNLPRRFCLMI